MAQTFGDTNPKLTKAIKRVARDSANVRFIPHAQEEMDNDGFDHDDVLVCLRKGMAHGPEDNGRCNVVHRGLHIRVVVGGLEAGGEDWAGLTSVTVITVMKAN